VSRLFIRSILQSSMSAIALAIGPSGCMHTDYLRSPSSTQASPPHHVWNHVGLRLQYLDTPLPAPVTCNFDECRLPSIDASLAVFERKLNHQCHISGDVCKHTFIQLLTESCLIRMLAHVSLAHALLVYSQCSSNILVAL